MNAPKPTQPNSLPRSKPGNSRRRGRRVARPRVDRFDRVDLGRRQTGRRVGAGAEQRLRIEVASLRFVQVPIRQQSPVASAALRDHRVGDDRSLQRIQALERNGPRDELDVLVRPLVPWRSGDDRVVVLRVPLRFHQRLVAAVRAAMEIRKAGTMTVERVNECLAGLRGHVVAAVRVVVHLFRMAERPVGRRNGMSEIRIGDRVSALQRPHHRRVPDRARQRAVADAEKLAVPVRRIRHPELHLNAGVGRRRQRRRHLAEGKRRRHRDGGGGGRVAVRRCREWRGDVGRRCDGAVEQVRARQARAGGRCDRASRGEQHRRGQGRTEENCDREDSPLLHDLLQCAPAVRSRQRRRSL